MFVSIFPTIQSQSANLEEILKFYPESMMKAFNIDIKAYTTIGGYISGELFSFMWPIMFISYICGFAGSALAGEIEKGTIEVLLSQPISRAKIYFAKYFAGLAMILVFVFVSVFSIPLILKFYHLTIDIKNVIAIFNLSLLWGLAIYSLGFFFSSIFSDKGKVYFLLGGLLVLMFALNIISGLKENLGDLKYLSFFYYFNANNALIYNKVDYLAYWVFGSSSIFFTFLGLEIFNKRNITT